ncbi:MAG: hypothetical protein QOG20_255 [Pseudonocardiales bacterium]|jgi:hypothetical protein|nr:hypothetical protein [Pseudonocardiales bacterium]
MTPTAAPVISSAPTATSAAVDGFLSDVLRGSVSPAHYAPGAVLDAVVPGWRLTALGPEAIAQEYGRWFHHPARFEDLRRLPTATGEVVEYTLTWTEDGVGHTGRHVHVIDVDGATRAIASDHVWCGGRWPADLLAEMEQARHAH